MINGIFHVTLLASHTLLRLHTSVFCRYASLFLLQSSLLATAGSLAQWTIALEASRVHQATDDRRHITGQPQTLNTYLG
jgi:hypothetical protein